MFLLLINELKSAFTRHTIEYRNIPIEDPISVSEIFTKLNSFLAAVLPDAWWSDLLMNGVLAGLSGILVFVPQIINPCPLAA